MNTTTLADMIETSSDFDEYKRDFVVPGNSITFLDARECRFSEDVPLFGNIGSVPFEGDMTDWALKQLAAKWHSPAPSWMLSDFCPKDLAATIWNRLSNEYPKDLLVRTYNGGIRAVLSKDYSRFDNTMILQSVSEICNSAQIFPSIYKYYNGPDFVNGYALLDNITIDVDPRDGKTPLHPGFYFGNGEIGNSHVKIFPMVFTGICQNGAIFGKKDRLTEEGEATALSVMHRGKSLQILRVLIANTIQYALDLSEEVIEKYVGSYEVGLSVEALKNTIGALSSKYSFTPDLAEQWVMSAQREYISRGAETPSVGDLINGLTFQAHTLEPVEAQHIEMVAGEILTSMVQ